MARAVRAAAALVVAAAVLAGAAGAGPAGVDPTVAGPAAAPPPTPLGGQSPSDIVLRVQSVGGFDASTVPAAPAVTLYDDGHLVLSSLAGDAVPALVGLDVRTLEPAALELLVDGADGARLADGDHADPPAPDAETTVITFLLDGRTHTSAFAGLAPRPEDPPDVADRRARAAAYLDGLRRVEDVVGPDAVSVPEPLAPERLAATARPVLGGGDAATKEWPPSAVDLAALSAAGPCSTLDGDTAAAVASALAGEDAATRWRQGARRWLVLASPLLPDQGGCPAAG